MNNREKTKKRISIVFLFFFSLVIVLVNAGNVFCADEIEDRSEQLEDKVVSTKEGALAELQTTSEIIELLKQRALLRIKKKRRERLLKVSLFSSVSGGYENNVNNDSAKKGDLFTSQLLMVTWQPTFNKYFSLNNSVLAFNQIYSDFTDTNYLYSSVSTGARFYPFSDGKLRLEPGLGYEVLWYPNSLNSSYNTVKYFLKTKNFISRTLSADLNFEFSLKEYDNRKARNPSGVTQEFVREDERYTFEAGLTRRIGRFSLGLKEKVYRNTSNDLLQELNDYYSHKSSLTLSGTFLEDNRLYIAFTPSFERKNYKVRLAVDRARFDDRYNYKFAAYYKLNENYTLTYKFDHWNLNSNSRSSEYTNIINQIGISAKF